MNDVYRDNCDERHRRVDDKLNHHESWLGEHEQKIDRLDRSDATNTQAINNLTQSISAQTKAIWGLVITMLTMFGGFFFYCVEKGLFK